jgi:hypothetical protein
VILSWTIMTFFLLHKTGLISFTVGTNLNYAGEVSRKSALIWTFVSQSQGVSMAAGITSPYWHLRTGKERTEKRKFHISRRKTLSKLIFTIFLNKNSTSFQGRSQTSTYFIFLKFILRPQQRQIWVWLLYFQPRAGHVYDFTHQILSYIKLHWTYMLNS